MYNELYVWVDSAETIVRLSSRSGSATEMFEATSQLQICSSVNSNRRPCLENLAAEGCSKCRRMTTTREMKRRRLPEVESDDDDGQREGPMVEVMGD